MTTPSSLRCPACGRTVAGGRFCSHCGTSLTQASCGACGAGLTPGARFCHRCGEPAGGSVSRHDERVAWTIASVVGLALIGAIGWYLVRGTPAAAVPDMANPGGGGGAPALSTQASDISQMTRREQFDRLYDRISQAAAAGDTAEVRLFTPMALGAYALLDTFDTDARFHAALLDYNIGDFGAALALADTIAAASPGHLFVPMIRAMVAEAQGNATALKQADSTFLADYAAERRTGRQEYADHGQAIEDFRKAAERRK
ncbi:MAG: zinc ribbon domain-containing protein [Gemmatimonadales bacterium]